MKKHINQSLRIDAELYEAFVELCRQQARSANNMMTHLIQQAIQQAKEKKQ